MNKKSFYYYMKTETKKQKEHADKVYKLGNMLFDDMMLSDINIYNNNIVKDIEADFFKDLKPEDKYICTVKDITEIFNYINKKNAFLEYLIKLGKGDLKQ